MAVEIPRPKPYRDPVSTIVPVSDKKGGSWPGSHEKASDQGSKKSE